VDGRPSAEGRVRRRPWAEVVAGEARKPQTGSMAGKALWPRADATWREGALDDELERGAAGARLEVGIGGARGRG
jgi:hypothetical protein